MLQNVRHAFRILAKNPGFAAIAILSLALGIGANTAIFTLIDTVMLRALPVRDPGQLVVLARNPEKPSTFFNYPDYVYIRDHNKSYSGVIATNGGSSAWALSVPGEGGGGRSEIVAGALVAERFRPPQARRRHAVRHPRDQCAMAPDRHQRPRIQTAAPPSLTPWSHCATNSGRLGKNCNLG